MINFFPELKKPRSDGLASALGLEDLRNPYEIYFGLFGEDDSGGGSDNVDRSNPAEMAARERAAARAGTVTDSQGNPVTSGDGTSVVTAGTQGQQVAAREAFNAATGNERSNFAQDQYDQVRAREDAALQRAARAGRLAGSDRGVDAGAINQALGRSDPNDIFVPTISPAESLRQATARMMGDDPNAPVPLTVAEQAALDEQTARSDRGIIALAQRQNALNAINNNLGITTSPTATAASVLDPASVPPADMLTASRELRTTAPALGGITTIQGPTAQELANLDALAKVGFDDDTAEMGIRGPGSGYDARGLPTGLEFITNNQGITTTRNLAGLTAAQRANMPSYMNTRADGPEGQAFGGDTRGIMGAGVDFVFGNPAQSAYGYELDAQGNVTGMVGKPSLPSVFGTGAELLTNALLGPPQTEEDLFNRGVYTGFGPGSQVGMDGSDDGGEVKSPTDPCPEGFVLKDGVCTPVDQAGGDTGGGPGGDFKILPIAPPTFQPITQATPVNQINPFVLQPYTPMQAQNIGASRVAQGIQGVSPTGAALGRQI